MPDVNIYVTVRDLVNTKVDKELSTKYQVQSTKYQVQRTKY